MCFKYFFFTEITNCKFFMINFFFENGIIITKKIGYGPSIEKSRMLLDIFRTII